MAVIPSGMVSLPLHYLRLTIAGSASFQTWVGAANASAALANIHVIAANPDAAKPLAVVNWAENFLREFTSKGTRNQFTQSGDVAFLLRAAINVAHDEADAAYTFTNTLGALIAEMEALSGLAGYLDIRAMNFEQPPERPREDEIKTIGDFYQTIIRVRYEGGPE